MVCPVCGEQCPAGARFCPNCGNPLPSPAAIESRRVVTIVFCDVVGSTALADRVDPEVLRSLMNAYHERVATAAQAFGGTVEKFIGDAAVAMFGVPRLHEDDALRAVRAAVAMRDAAGLDVRIGIATGEVVTGEGRTIASGEALNLAARLQQSAAAGEIVLAAATVDAVAGAVDVEPIPGLELRGWDGSVAAFRLTRVTGDRPIPRRMDVALVGRDRERRFILDAFERVVADGACHLVTVLGEPGIGKSRLMTAALQEMRGLGATTLIARCRPFGESTPLRPLEEILQESGGPALDVLDYDDAFTATREHFESLARERPLVVVFDDAHWAEGALLDLIDRLADGAGHMRLLIMAGARPELFDVRAGWGGGKPNAASLRLAPLDAEATLLLIDEIAADTPLEPEARRRVAALAEGNPLFAEQMAMVLAEGRADVPATIQALLAARLDVLPPADRELLERASIEGRAFRLAALAALGPCESEAGLRARLEQLVERRILDFAPMGEFRFHHHLVRDEAYRATPKHRRAELHRAFARWQEKIEPRAAGVVGHHLAEAYRYRVELGLDDEETAELCVEAALALRRAGQRAIAAGDSATACEELERAARLTGDADAGTLSDLGVALRGAGRLDESAGRLEQARRLAEEAGDGRIAWRARVEWLPVARSLGRIDRRTQREIAREAVAALTAADDDLGLARAYQALGDAERALVHARAAGARREEAEILVDLGWQWVGVPTTVAEAVERVMDLMEAARGNRRAEAGLAVCLALLRVCEGRLAEAEVALARSLEVYRGLGRLYGVASVIDSQAEAALAANDLELATRRLRAAIAISERTGDILRRGYWLCRLALVAALDGRAREALELTEQAERTGPGRDWRAARALALACLGDGEAALGWAESAFAEDGDDPVWPYDARRSQAAALAAAARRDEAAAAFASAIGDAAASGNWFEADLTRRVAALFEGAGELPEA
jgi:class 3 adenylate cyclase/predicted ATPase